MRQRVGLHGRQVEDPAEQRVDAVAPVTQLAVERIAGTDSYTLRWDSSDARGGSGFKHVTLYVAVDGGDFKIWQRRLEQSSGELLFDGEAGKRYDIKMEYYQGASGAAARLLWSCSKIDREVIPASQLFPGKAAK